MAGPWKDEELEASLSFLKEKRGLDFTGCKRASVGRRVARRMQAAGMDSLPEYMDRLQVDPDEFVHLLSTILINVTGLFRDASAWQYLAQEVVPEIIAGKGPPPWSASGARAPPPGRRPTAWPSCSRRRWASRKPSSG